MKYIPNLLTLFRILSTLLLYFIEPWSASFYSIYLFGGLSDVLDGWIARTFKLSSSTGARLDSLADAFYFITLMYHLLLTIKPGNTIMLLLSTIAFIRFLSLLTGLIRFKKITFLHTYANKISGLLIFLLPFTLSKNFFTLYLTLTLIICLISAIEEWLLLLTCQSYNPNIKSYYHKNHVS